MSELFWACSDILLGYFKNSISGTALRGINRTASNSFLSCSVNCVSQCHICTKEN